MTILAIDFMNAAHRARSGFTKGNYSVVFNYFRQLRALVNKFKPTRVYIALEGKPVHRHSALTEYKANRKIDPEDPKAAEKAAEMEAFFAQKDVIVRLLKQNFPVSVIRHPTSEADDTLANVIRRSSTAVDWVLVSSDTDFIQLLQTQPNLRLYNPVTEKFGEPPADYDYVTWKALRGDASDNIPGIPGVGDKTAAKIASDGDRLKEYVCRPEIEPIFTRNYDLIRFTEWSDDEASEMTCSSPTQDWDAVKAVFSGYGFNSLVKDGSWQKYITSFSTLWGS